MYYVCIDIAHLYYVEVKNFKYQFSIMHEIIKNLLRNYLVPTKYYISCLKVHQVNYSESLRNPMRLYKFFPRNT